MRGIRTGFGLSVADVPMLTAARLALLGPPRQGLAFVDRWRPASRRAGRILCSDALAKAWPAGRALGLPWGVPMQIGNLTVAAGPAGSSPEAAVLRVQLDERLLVCALAGRGRALPGCAAADVTEADILLVDGAGLSWTGGAHNAAAKDADDATIDHAALAAIETLMADGGGVIAVDDERLATAVVAVLPASATLYANGSIAARIARFSGRLARRFSKRLPHGGVLIVSRSTLPETSVSARRLHFVAPGAAVLPDWRAMPWTAGASSHSLRELIERSGAQDVVVWHTKSDEVAQLEGCAARLWHLLPDAQLSFI